MMSGAAWGHMKKLRFALLGLLLGLSTIALAGDTNVPGRLIVQQTDAAPTCSTGSGNGALCVEGATELQSTALITGAASLSSTLAVDGATSLGGTLTMGTGADLGLAGNELTGQLTNYEDKIANYTVVTPTDCGRVLVTNDDNRVFTIPDAATTNSGCEIKFIVIAASDAAKVSLSPADPNDSIWGTCCGVVDAGTTTCVGLSGTAGKDLECAKAECDRGDNVVLVSDGATGWYATGCVGSGWASES